MRTSKLNKFWHRLSSFITHPVSYCKLQIHAVDDRFNVGVLARAIKQENVYTQGQLKLTHINFVILNSYVTVTYFRFIKKHLFLDSKKQKNWK